MKEFLKKICKQFQIECVGIAGIGPYRELEKILKARIQKGQYTEFEEQDLQKRIDPRATMENVQSIIVCAFPYFCGNFPGGNVAKYTYALDYHQIIRAKLAAIGEGLAERLSGFQYQAYVDNGPLVDRYLAYLAGLGFYGMNSHIITEKYGSYVVIGYMLTNYPFEADKALERTCMQCGRCGKACPGNVILGNFAIDPRRCKSYLTQKKGQLTEEEVYIVQKTDLVFGCDHCQEVCPHNANVSAADMKEFRENLLCHLPYDELTALSNKTFGRQYKNRAFAWRGKQVLIRNFHYLRERNKSE